jgi:hypothetical protein
MIRSIRFLTGTQLSGPNLFYKVGPRINRFHQQPTASSAGMDLTAVVKALQKFAPKSLAENWDNVGLLGSIL